MVHTWPGQTKEEYLEEYWRDRALTPEERKREWDEEIEKANKRHEEYEKNNSFRVKPNSDEWLYIHAESPNSLDDGEATVTWIIIMIIGSIFNARWLIWILATAIYLYRMNRYAIRKWKWDKGGKEEYYKKIENACKGDK
jgi:hypothetical protein